MSDQQHITAEAYIRRLAERGIEYVFANAGTDFAPIIEAISRNAGSDRKIPKFVTVPHENVAMAMAHGYYRACGKPAAVMVHVTVGTANTVCGLMNMARDNVPVLAWMWLRGRCRACRDRISPRYPLIESATAALCVGVVLSRSATARSIGARKRSTRAPWCASSSNGTTSCAPASRSRRWSTARSTWR